MDSLSPSATNKHWEHHKMNQTESFTGIWLVHKRNLSSVQKPSELSVLPGFNLSHTSGYFENAVAWEITDQRLAFFFTVIMHCSHKRLIYRQWKMNMDTFTNVYWSLKWMPGNLKSRKREWRRDGGVFDVTSQTRGYMSYTHISHFKTVNWVYQLDKTGVCARRIVKQGEKRM